MKPGVLSHHTSCHDWNPHTRIHTQKVVICRSLKKRKRKHGMNDVRERSFLLPNHMDLIMNDNSSSSSCSLSETSGNMLTSSEVMRITDRLLSVDAGDERGGSSGSNKHQPVLQMGLMAEGFTLKLLPVSGLKVNGSSNNNNNNNNNGSEGHEVFLPYDEGCGIMQDIENGTTPPVLLDYLMAKYPSRLSGEDYGQDVDILMKDLRSVPDVNSSSSNHLNHHPSESSVPTSNCNVNHMTRHVRLKSSNSTIAKIIHHKIMTQNHQHRLTHPATRSSPPSPSPSSSSSSTTSRNQIQRLQPHLQQEQHPNHDNQVAGERGDSSSVPDGTTTTTSTVQMNGHVGKEEEDDVILVTDGSMGTIRVKSEPAIAAHTPTTPIPPNRGKSRSRGSTKDKDDHQHQGQGVGIAGDPKQGSCWDQESQEMDRMESQVIHNSSPTPLCLNPSPVVHLIHNRLSGAGVHRNDILGLGRTPPVRRKLLLADRSKRKSMSRSTRVEEEDEREEERLFLASNPHLRLSTFLHRRQERANLLNPAESQRRKASTGSMSGSSSTSNNTSEAVKLDMEKVSEEITRLSAKLRNMCAHMSRANETTLTKIEEYVMVFDASPSSSPSSQQQQQQQQQGSGIQAVTCVSIFHRQIDDVFFGQLFVDRPGMPSCSSRSCLYQLGSRDAAKKYLEQFREILTENGRKAVRITRTGSTGVITSSFAGPPLPLPPHPSAQPAHPLPPPPAPSPRPPVSVSLPSVSLPPVPPLPLHPLPPAPSLPRPPLLPPTTPHPLPLAPHLPAPPPQPQPHVPTSNVHVVTNSTTNSIISNNLLFPIIIIPGNNSGGHLRFHLPSTYR